MALEPGTSLGPYKVVAAIGAGGMGEVYRASDSRLQRDVAIKVLPAQFADSPDSLRRFEQEARSAAALDHPGLLAVFDVGVFEGAPYLVTELLQGATLRQLLGDGRLPLAKVRELARQLLEALAAAHDRSIVHRDLKPENLFQTHDGRLKILDFGLAKLLEPPASELPGAMTQADCTEQGALLGTVGYMAPEQARGESVDHRADLFAVGAIVHEMLTGERAFAAASAVETLHAILHVEPPAPSTVVTTLPPTLDVVLRRSLAKSRTDRFQSARDFAFALDLACAAAAPAGTSSSAAPSVWRRATLLTAGGVAAGALLAVLATGRMSGRDAASLSGAAVEVGALTPLTVDPGYEGQPSFSPDGETVAYVSDRTGDFEIYLKQVSGGPAINLSRDPGDDAQPAISPDGRQIAFVSTRSSRLALIYRSPDMPLMGGDVWVMPVLGGLPRKVSEDANFPSWSPDGKTIYFARSSSYRSEIRRVPATGTASEAVPIALPDGFTTRMMHHPRVSPDGEWLLFLAGEQIIYVPIAGGTAISLAMGSDAIWDPDGKSVLFCNADPGRNWGLWRIPFAPNAAGGAGGAGAPAVATPVLPGPSAIEGVAIAASGDRLVAAKLDRTANLEELQLDAEAGVSVGTELPLTRGHDPIAFASPSPDSRSIVYESRRGASDHLWRLDDGQEPVQLTSDPAWADSFPRWSPDGRWIAFARRPAGAARRPQLAQLWLMSPDGGGPRRLVEEAGHMAWLPDSRGLVFLHGDQYARADVASGSVVPLTISGPSRLPIFAISPDGQWIVYQSPDGGDIDLLRVPITGGEARVAVRTEKQDFHPSFSPSGRWLYFQTDHRNLWRVPGPAQDWRAAAPEKITRFPESGLYIEDPLLSADGQRLIYSRIRISADLWIVELDKAGSL